MLLGKFVHGHWILQSSERFLHSPPPPPTFSSGVTKLISFLFFKGLRIRFLSQGSSKISSLGCDQILQGNTLLLWVIQDCSHQWTDGEEELHQDDFVMVFSSGRGSFYGDPGRGRLFLGMLVGGCLHKPHSLFLSRDLYYYYFSRDLLTQ